MTQPKRGRPARTPNSQPFFRQHGQYTITKPHDKYVVKVGGNVLQAFDTLEKAQEYLDAVGK